MGTLVKKEVGASRKVTASSPEKKTAKVKDSSPITMPKLRNVPPKDFKDYSGLIYGEKAVGKTSLIAELVDVVLMLERGRKNLPILQIPDHSRKEPPLTWERTLDYRDLFISEGKIRNIGVDTLDRHYELCFNYICKQFGVKKPSDAGSEAPTVWTTMKREYEEWAVSLIEAGISIIWTSHARLRDVHGRLQEGFQQVTPTCSDAPWNIAKSLTDYGIYYGYYGRQRGLQIRGNSLTWCGCNLDGRFLDPKTKEQLEAIDAGLSAKQAAKNLLLGYENKISGVIFDPTEPDEEEEAEE